MKAALLLLTICSLAVGLAGCGGGGGAGTVSRSEYRSELTKISQEAGVDHQRVEAAAPRARTVAQVQAVLRHFAAAEDRLGDEITSLKVPADAQSANAELARAQHDDATAIRGILPKLARFTSAQQAFAYLQGVGNTKGGQEGDDALARLRKLGYTNGS